MQDLIKKAQNEYDKGSPIMSDEAFDNLTNDESQFKLTDDTYTIKHILPMGSMKKVHSIDQIPNQKYYVQPKFDGVSCEVQINENGELISASTRGNGEYGKDISHIQLFKNTKFNPKLRLLYGEITLVSKKPSQRDRNIVAGVLNSKKSSDEYLLEFHVFNAHEDFGEYLLHEITEYEIPKIYISNNPLIRGSETLEISLAHKDNIKLIKDKFNEMYPNTKRDGIVFKSLFDPPFALKPKSLSAVTKLKDVSWTKGKSKFAATAIIEPITLGDVTISKVTLPDKYIREMDLHIGDYIEVSRSNDVIPRIIGLVEPGKTRKKIKVPNKCPYGHDLEKFGKVIYCSNKNCKSIEESYTHSVKDIMFWGVTRPPRSKLSRLISENKISLNEILYPDKYSHLITKREYELCLIGANNFNQQIEEKMLVAFNVDSLTFKKSEKIIKEKGIINILEDPDNILEESASRIYNNSDSISKFINDNTPL